jgi:hypothetical protein
MPLTFDQLAEWQGVVLGASAPAELRTTDAYAKGGRDRYAYRADLHERVAKAIADTQATTASLVVRAARIYLDICFYHPFADGNARAARLALDHVLTSAGHALQLAAPLFRLPRPPDDVPAAYAFAAAVDLLAGPRAQARALS